MGRSTRFARRRSGGAYEKGGSMSERATPSRADVAVSKVEIPQYRLRTILAVWAAAALPMAALAWLVAPALEDHFSGEGSVPLVKALLLLLTGGLIWQFVLVVVLVWREQGTLRWSIVREALWLRSPRDPKSGRRGGRVWFIVIPLFVAFDIETLLPEPSHRRTATSGSSSTPTSVSTS